MSNLRELRIEAGLSIVKLAALAGVDPATVQHAETGKTTMNRLTARALTAALSERLGRKITIDDLGASVRT